MLQYAISSSSPGDFVISVGSYSFIRRCGLGTVTLLQKRANVYANCRISNVCRSVRHPTSATSATEPSVQLDLVSGTMWPMDLRQLDLSCSSILQIIIHQYRSLFWHLDPGEMWTAPVSNSRHCSGQSYPIGAQLGFGWRKCKGYIAFSRIYAPPHLPERAATSHSLNDA